MVVRHQILSSEFRPPNVYMNAAAGSIITAPQASGQVNLGIVHTMPGLVAALSVQTPLRCSSRH